MNYYLYTFDILRQAQDERKKEISYFNPVRGDASTGSLLRQGFVGQASSKREVYPELVEGLNKSQDCFNPVRGELVESIRTQ